MADPPSGPSVGWHADPTGRHQYRYWDGRAWTDQVSDDGRLSTDPVGGGFRSWILVVVAVLVLLALVGTGLFLVGTSEDDEASDDESEEQEEEDEDDSQEEIQEELEPPTLSDHWHTAYAVNVCGRFLEPFDSQEDPVGIHSHTDGVVHIHPFTTEVAGDNATLEVFLDTMGAELTDDTLELPGGEEVSESDGCDGEDAEWVVAYWDDAAAVDEPPEVATEDLADVRFEGNLAALTIALLPPGDQIPPPPSIPYLDQLGGVSPVLPAPTTTPD